jgi:hypothetical protein
MKRAVRSAKAGRNDPCPCGSGRKLKRCCGGRRGLASTRVMLAAVAVAILAAIVMVVSSVNREPGAAPPGRVWSEEHGHWHEVP